MKSNAQNIWNTNNAELSAAADRLSSGLLIAIPTETVYGLAADAADGEAVAAIYATKGRPSFNPLIVHVTGLEDAKELAELDERAVTLAQTFWPGALTLVLPLKETADISSLVTAGLPTVAVRCPAHPVARRVLELLGRPFVAPSANRSGQISPTRAQHVIDEFDGQIPVLDGGPCQDGVESTILSLAQDTPILLRPGSITKEEIESALGTPVSNPQGSDILAPGMMSSHYAPQAKLRLNATTAKDDEALLGFGDTPGATLDLSPQGNLIEAAANLFDYLRTLDQRYSRIAVAPIPTQGVGYAINDRLARAAAPRP